MVLQDGNESAPDSFSDDPYPSANDPYASSPSSSGFRFDSSSFPQPPPLIGPALGYSEHAIRLKTELGIKYSERRVGRTLQPDESQALAFHIYRLEQRKSYFAASAFVAGTWRWWATWDKMRYPFYQPTIADPNKFLNIHGPVAKYARHSWRLLLYTTVAVQMGNIVGQIIAQPLTAVETSKDPKLEQFGTELKAAFDADHQKSVQRGRDIEARRRDFQEQVKNRSGGGPSPQAAWGKQQPKQSDDFADDSSPTAGNEAWSSSRPGAESWETFSNDTAQPPALQQQTPQSTTTWNRQPRPSHQAQSSSSPFDDDASPTGGLFQDEVINPPKQSQPVSRPGESTWDRLRRGVLPVPTQSPPQQSRRANLERNEQKEGSTPGDSYAFVEGDDDRKREREQAQRDFDARIERERQGRDFASDEGKRW